VLSYKVTIVSIPSYPSSFRPPFLPPPLPSLPSHVRALMHVAIILTRYNDTYRIPSFHLVFLPTPSHHFIAHLIFIPLPLPGECTDLKVAAAFTKDIKEVGYGTMRINNYRKNNELFTATVIVFPVYDTVEPNGQETENPVLTHFATMLTQIETLRQEEVEPIIPTSISKCGLGTSGKSVPSKTPYDRRQNCRKYDIEYALTPDSFKDISTTVRLSDLLRLMLCSSEAMVLYDTRDRIVHTNKAYTRMTGYSLSDVEGKNNYVMLQGPLTDVLAVERCVTMCRKREEVSQVTVISYRKGKHRTNG